MKRLHLLPSRHGVWNGWSLTTEGLRRSGSATTTTIERLLPPPPSAPGAAALHAHTHRRTTQDAYWLVIDWRLCGRPAVSPAGASCLTDWQWVTSSRRQRLDPVRRRELTQFWPISGAPQVAAARTSLARQWAPIKRVLSIRRPMPIATGRLQVPLLLITLRKQFQQWILGDVFFRGHAWCVLALVAPSWRALQLLLNFLFTGYQTGYV